MKRLFLTTALVAATSLPLAAQSNDELATSSMVESSDGMQIQASNLIGKRIYLPEDGATTDGQASTDHAEGFTDAQDDWDMAGEITDVILTRDGEVSALLVDAGGFLGMGETERRIDMDDLRFASDTDDEGEFFVIFTGDRSTFEQSEAYNQDTASAEGEMRGSDSWGADEAEYETVDYASVTTEELLGAAAYGSGEEWLGEVSELALADGGMIDKVIIDVGGFLGIGEKPVALSMDQVELRRVNGNELRAYVSATEEELESMETWTASDM